MALEEASYSLSVADSRNAAKRKGYPQVDICYYREGEKICKGGVAGTARVYVVHPTIYAFGNHAKKLVLSPRWYIQAPTTRGGLSFFRLPCVVEEDGRALAGFMEINRTTLAHGRWITFF